MKDTPGMDDLGINCFKNIKARTLAYLPSMDFIWVSIPKDLHVALMYNWIDQNTIGNITVFNSRIGFTDAKEAVLFKLRFGSNARR